MRGGGLVVAGGGVERPGEQRLPQHLRVGGVRLFLGQGNSDGDQGLGDRPARDRGEVRPLGLGVGAGVGVPGDRLVFGDLGLGQAGAGVEGPPVADRVLQLGEEPVGQRAGLERLAVLTAVDRPPDPEPCPGAAAELLDVPEPDVVTVHLLLLLSVLRVLFFQAAQPRGQRAAPDPHPAARQPHDRRPGSPPAPAVESRPGHPQLGDHLIDRQQRVIRGSGCSVRGGGGPAGSGWRSRGRPVRGSATTDAPLCPPRQVRPPPGRQRRPATRGCWPRERKEEEKPCEWSDEGTPD